MDDEAFSSNRRFKYERGPWKASQVGLLKKKKKLARYDFKLAEAFYHKNVLVGGQSLPLAQVIDNTGADRGREDRLRGAPGVARLKSGVDEPHAAHQAAAAAFSKARAVQGRPGSGVPCSLCSLHTLQASRSYAPVNVSQIYDLPGLADVGALASRIVAQQSAAKTGLTWPSTACGS